MTYFVGSVNRNVIHTTDHNLHITVGEHFMCPGNQKEYKAIGIISNIGSVDKTVVLRMVSCSDVSYNEHLQTGEG